MFCSKGDPDYQVVYETRLTSRIRNNYALKIISVMADYLLQERCRTNKIPAPVLDYFNVKRFGFPDFSTFLDYYNVISPVKTIFHNVK